MTSQDERPEVTVEVDLPSCSLTRDDILELIRRIERSADWGEHTYRSIEVCGRDYTLSATKASQLTELDWPSSLTDVSVYVSESNLGERRRVSFSASESSAEMIISHRDAVWVQGVAAQFEGFFAQRRNPHRVVRNYGVGLALGVLTYVLVFGAVALGLFAADRDIFEESRAARLAAVMPPVIFWPVAAAAPMLMLWLFPYVEFEPQRSTRKTMRRLIVGGGSTLLVAVVADFAGAGLWLLLQ